MNPRPEQQECLFCCGDDPSLNRILCESKDIYVRYDNFPAAPGHVQIVPRRHVESLFDLAPQEIVQVHELMRDAVRLLAQEGVDPDGWTIGVNEGRAAGRSVDHVHCHLLPRYFGDVADPRGGIRRVMPDCDPDAWA